MTNPFALDTPPAAPPATAPAAQLTVPPVAQTNPALDADFQRYVAAQQAAAAAQPAAPAAGATDDPFAGPAPQTDRPRIRDLHGRLLLVRPLLVERVQQADPETGTMRTVERMTADVIVLDGGPLNYGGAPEKLGGKPHDKSVPTPHKIDKMFISSVGLVSQSRDALANRIANLPGPKIVLGRLTTGVAKTDKNSPPYLLTIPTEQEKETARAYLRTVDPLA